MTVGAKNYEIDILRNCLRRSELFGGSLSTLPLELVNVVHVNQCKYKYLLLACLYKVSQPD